MPDAVCVAGGTAVMVDRSEDPGPPAPLLDLSAVWELTGCRELPGGGLRLGAATSFTEVLERHGAAVPILALALRTVASPQIRNRATLGGAVALADPTADALAALAAAGAVAIVIGPDGERRAPAADVRLATGELVVAVEIPRSPGPAAYAKLGARNAMARAVCGVAVVLDPRSRSVRIALAGVGPVVVCATTAEEHVAATWDQLDDPSRFAEAGRLAANATSPRSDARGTAAYRRRLTAVLVRRALRRAWAQLARAEEGMPAHEWSDHADWRADAEASHLTVDGVAHRLPPALEAESLLRVMREHLGLTQVKNACEQGECGSCTVRIEGRLACACLVPAGQAVGTRVDTAAARASEGVRDAFARAGAIQCGFCTPGFVVAATDLLQRHARPSDEEIRETLSGNLCRCTGYHKILDAVRDAAAA